MSWGLNLGMVSVTPLKGRVARRVKLRSVSRQVGVKVRVFVPWLDFGCADAEPHGSWPSDSTNLLDFLSYYPSSQWAMIGSKWIKWEFPNILFILSICKSKYIIHFSYRWSSGGMNGVMIELSIVTNSTNMSRPKQHRSQSSSQPKKKEKKLLIRH